MAVNMHIRSSHTHMTHMWQLFVHTQGTEVAIKMSINGNLWRSVVAAETVRSIYDLMMVVVVVVLAATQPVSSCSLGLRSARWR